MLHKFLIANWKSNKTSKEIVDWFEKINKNLDKQTVKKRVKIIIAPSFPYLSLCKKLIERFDLPFSLAAQNLSPFEKGSYTGEVNAEQIKEFAEYVIIGHSERRKYFKEEKEILKQKILRAKEKGLEPIYCTTKKEENLKLVKIIAFEPEFAIGSGKNAPLDFILEEKEKLNLEKDQTFLYGGSVNPQNIDSYLKSKEINGFLIGKASLNPTTFLTVIEKIL